MVYPQQQQQQQQHLVVINICEDKDMLHQVLMIHLFMQVNINLTVLIVALAVVE